jgi:hypothetical protein
MIVAYNIKGNIGILNYDFLLIKFFNQNHNNGKYVVCIFMFTIGFYIMRKQVQTKDFHY